MNAGIPYGREANMRSKNAPGLIMPSLSDRSRALQLARRAILFGIAHPNYKHGLYSKHCPSGIVRRGMLTLAAHRERAIKRGFDRF